MPSGNEQSLECENDYFGFDPVKGSDKMCQYSDGAYYTLSDGETLDECATEGQICNSGVGNVVLIRYGTKDRYDWRFLHSAANTDACNNDTFGVAVYATISGPIRWKAACKAANATGRP